MLKKKVAIGALIAMSAVAAQAQSYVDIGYGTTKYSESGFSSTPTAVRAVFGQNINDNFAVEVLGASGVSNGTGTYSGYGITLKLNSIVGAYITPKVKVGNAELFARAGYAKTNGTITATGAGGSATLTASGSSPSFGSGVKLNLGNGSSITADYMSYYSKDGTDINGVTVSYGFSF